MGLGVFRLGRLIRNFKMIWEGVGVPRMIMRIYWMIQLVIRILVSPDESWRFQDG